MWDFPLVPESASTMSGWVDISTLFTTAIVLFFLMFVAMNVLVFPYQHMLSVFARDVLAGGPGVLGALVAAEGLGALAGALAIAAQRRHLPQERLFALSIALTPILVVAFALSPSFEMCLAILVALGLVEAAFGATQTTVVLLAAPERVRGGTVGILSACIGTQPATRSW